MGLLGEGFDDPRSAAIMALAGGLLRRDFGGGLLGANQAFNEARAGQARQAYMNEQMQAMREDRAARQAKAQQEAEALRRAEELRREIPTLFRQPGMAGGQPMPQEMGGIPMFSKPMGAAPMQATPGGFDVQRALALGMSPEQINAYAGLQNVGRQEVARTIETTDPQGRPVTIQLDKFGQPIGQGLGKWVAPVMQNLGGSVAAIDPVTLAQRGSFAVGMSPAERDAAENRRQTLELQRQRFDFDKTNATARQPQGGTDAGKPLTEGQAKANLFGSRMLEANRILNEMEDPTTGQLKYSPLGIANRAAASGIPLLGGAAGAAANTIISNETQMADQAQRDFINAVLRRESGAVIADSEFQNARQQYFPQVGDSPAVIKQKRKNRETAIAGIRAEIPGGFRGGLQSGGATGDFGTPTADNDPLGLRK